MTASMTTRSMDNNDFVAIIMKDHEKVNELYDEFNTIGNAEDQQQILFEFIRELSVHSHKEALFLYPLMEKVLPDGKKLVKEAIDEHRTVETLLQQIDMLADDVQNISKIKPLFKKLMVDLTKHIEEEETDLLPSMKENLDKSTADQLLKDWQTEKVSTRPHPDAPMEASVNVLAEADRKAAQEDKLLDKKRFGSSKHANDDAKKILHH